MAPLNYVIAFFCPPSTLSEIVQSHSGDNLILSVVDDNF